MEDDSYESVLHMCREVFVYKLPPRTSNAGYKAAEWGDLEGFLWKGRLRILERGLSVPSKCLINLEDPSSGELFAQCPYSVKGTEVEAVLDSSRYFVLKVVDSTNGGANKHAYIGMGFPERTDAFDFNVALQDWSKRQRPDPPAGSSSSKPSPFAPTKDFSLKEGETITIKIGGKGGGVKKGAGGGGGGSLLGGGGGEGGGAGAGGMAPLLPPPPSAPRRG